jgi:hypothetical protein
MVHDLSVRSDDIVDVTVPMNYVEPPDCPEGMTLREYRRLRRPAPRRRRDALAERLRRRPRLPRRAAR